MWKWRGLTLAGKVTIFKTMAISKIVFASFLSTVPNAVITKMDEIQKYFLWNGKSPKVSQNVLISDYEDGGLRSVDIRAKIIALRISWLKRLYTGTEIMHGK